MENDKISALTALSLIASPIVSSAGTSSDGAKTTSTVETTSQRASIRRMNHQLAATPRLLEGSHPMTLEEATAFADQFVQKNNLPPYSRVKLEAKGDVVLIWRDFSYFKEKYPQVFWDNNAIPTDFQIVFPRKGIDIILVDWCEPYLPDDNHFRTQTYLQETELVR